ncbi:MAG: hypothetical protein AAGM67_11245 [Bacteroidota bacterium]
MTDQPSKLPFFCYETRGAPILTLAEDLEDGEIITDEDLSSYVGQEVLVPSLHGYRKARIEQFGSNYHAQAGDASYSLSFEYSHKHQTKAWNCFAMMNMRAVERLVIP